MTKILCLVIPPYGEIQKSRNINQSILMNVQNIYFDRTPFYLGNEIYLAKLLRALLSNKNRILHY